MPHPFDLSDSNFSRLQSRAVPLVDDLNSVIAKLLDLVEGDEPATEADIRASPSKIVKKFDPATPPDLTHTKVISVTFDGKQLDKPTWNGLKDAAIRYIVKTEKDKDKLKSLILCPFVFGKKEDEGYRYMADLGISVQSQDSMGAFKVAYHIASNHGCGMKIQFMWRQKEAALHPGMTGIMEIGAW
ncbi:MAG: hypothetical protein Q7J26_02595 [Brevundimonas sp.]|uniref:T4SS efffector SepA family protein n=1 Tax=Brevundimonas sp. TaxID=1871086 RepID=UPI00271E40CE|nr:hypothetical protein [Brevundimonas sp.]MDO9607388.1 hypothetical protein [Brevundimonas sp.]